MDMERQVIVMQGVSGSGKSTLAHKLAKIFGEQGVVVSADDFFRHGGAYNFDASKLGEAHDDCFRKFLGALTNDTLQVVIVDNTNTLATDAAPYMRAASAFGWRARILRVEVDHRVAAARNDGRAPATTVEWQAKNLELQRYPAYWTIQAVRSEDVATSDVQRLLRWPSSSEVR